MPDVLDRKTQYAQPAPDSEDNDSGALMREREASLSFALQAGRLGYWELDLRTWTLFCSDIYKANWGRAPADTFSYETLLSSIHPDDRAMHEAAVADAVDKGSTLDIDYRAIWPNQSVHWIRVRGHALYDDDGRPLRMAGISLDITDRKQIEESLREQTRMFETLNRVGTILSGNLDLEHIVQTATDAATELSGAQFGAFFYNVTDDKGESYALYTISGVPREAFSKFPMPRATDVFRPTFEGRGPVRSDDIRKDPRYGKNEPHFGMPKGHLPVVSYLAVPVISRSGEVLGGLFFGHGRPGVFTENAEKLVVGIAAQAAIAIDNARLFQEAQKEIAERRRVEEHQRLLLAELNHRVRNTLAIVQSIAGQTLRYAGNSAAFRASFEARIMALSEAHGLLTDSNWEGASARVITERVLNPYSTGGKARYDIDAQKDVLLGPNSAVSLVMALHELATNAAKYGALSNARGRVRIGWVMIEDNPAARRLRVRWEETGGPKVKVPAREGFGSRMIRGLASDDTGSATFDFRPAGLVCTFDLPLPLGAA